VNRAIWRQTWILDYTLTCRQHHIRMNVKVITIVGARPQFIKAATVSRILRDIEGIDERIIHTGQHYDHGMSDIFFEELDIPKPAYSLGIGSCSHGKQTGQMLAAIESALEDESPDWVLVYGDTNSTLAGALAAAKLHLPVAHVEAGLRSFNRAMPEEINRVVTDHLAELLLTPTRGAADQLVKEGIAPEKVQLVGDVMFDAALYYAERAARLRSVSERFGLGPKGFALATLHRAENTDNPARLSAIIDGLCRLAERVPVVMPLHPRTRLALDRCQLLQTAKAQLRIIDPVGYLEMIQLEQSAAVVVTDSGGVQKEAFFFKTPCVTLRDETEWTELVELGYNKLVGSDPAAIEMAADQHRSRTLDWTLPLYGDGRAAYHIVDLLSGRAGEHSHGAASPTAER
jgi:UDP-GlcNAc3NAcA epimerase